MDALDQAIGAKRQERDELREKLAHAELELQVLERAANLRPSAGSEPRATSRQPKRSERAQHKGRQPGAISKTWREILRRVAINYPAGATPSDFASFGQALGLPNLRPTDARQQLEKYATYSYVELVGPDRYRVTDAARERFGVLEPPSAGPDAPRSERQESPDGGGLLGAASG